jgi:hypothetical protein
MIDSKEPTVTIPVSHYDALESRITELEANRDKRDLEMMAKALKDYAKNNESGMRASWMIARADRYLERAERELNNSGTNTLALQAKYDDVFDDKEGE